MSVQSGALIYTGSNATVVTLVYHELQSVHVNVGENVVLVTGVYVEHHESPTSWSIMRFHCSIWFWPTVISDVGDGSPKSAQFAGNMTSISPPDTAIN